MAERFLLQDFVRVKATQELGMIMGFKGRKILVALDDISDDTKEFWPDELMPCY